MKVRLPRHSFRIGILSALLVAAGMVLSLQGCVPARGRVIIQAPPLVLPAPPYLYVVPGTYVYYAADADVDIFFYQGFWYRPHLGRWYIANEYNGPWTYIVINRVPLVIREVPHAYRRVPPRSGRLPYNDVRNNWRNWERERHWDRHDERKRERYEHENQSRGRDRYDSTDNDSRYRRPDRPVLQREQREREEPRYQDRIEYRDRDEDKDKDRGGARYEYRDNDQDEAKGRGQNDRRYQRRPSEPVRQLTQPQGQQQEKKQTPSKTKQKRDRNRGKDKDQDSDSSQDRDENSRDERGRGKGLQFTD